MYIFRKCLYEYVYFNLNTNFDYFGIKVTKINEMWRNATASDCKVYGYGFD